MTPFNVVWSIFIFMYLSLFVFIGINIKRLIKNNNKCQTLYNLLLNIMGIVMFTIWFSKGAGGLFLL